MSNTIRTVVLAMAALLAIACTPPEAEITDPELETDGEFVVVNTTHDRDTGLYCAEVHLVGGATDAEDGHLNGDSLVWRTDQQDEELGTGGCLWVELCGEDLCGNVGVVHTVTLTATDSDGRTDVETVPIRLSYLCK